MTQVTGTKTLKRLQTIATGLKLTGTITGRVEKGSKVEYLLGSTLLGKSAPEARKALKATKK